MNLEKLNDELADIKIHMARIDERTNTIISQISNMACGRHEKLISENKLEIEKTKRFIYVTFFTLVGSISGIIMFILRLTKVF